MKSSKFFLVSAFVIALGSAFVTKANTSLVNNRKDASCQPIEGVCQPTGDFACGHDEYDINDSNCQTLLPRKN